MVYCKCGGGSAGVGSVGVCVGAHTRLCVGISVGVGGGICDCVGVGVALMLVVSAVAVYRQAAQNAQKHQERCMASYTAWYHLSTPSFRPILCS